MLMCGNNRCNITSALPVRDMLADFGEPVAPFLEPALTALDRLSSLPGIDRKKLEPLIRLRSELDPFVLGRTIRRKLDRIWALKSTTRKGAPRADSYEEAKELAGILARKMERKKVPLSPSLGAS